VPYQKTSSPFSSRATPNARQLVSNMTFDHVKRAYWVCGIAMNLYVPSRSTPPATPSRQFVAATVLPAFSFVYVLPPFYCCFASMHRSRYLHVIRFGNLLIFLTRSIPGREFNHCETLQLRNTRIHVLIALPVIGVSAEAVWRGVTASACCARRQAYRNPCEPYLNGDHSTFCTKHSTCALLFDFPRLQHPHSTVRQSFCLSWWPLLVSNTVLCPLLFGSRKWSTFCLLKIRTLHQRRSI
jgi:hypothetical protein